MGTGCSAKRSTDVNDAESKVNLKKNAKGSIDDANMDGSGMVKDSKKSKLHHLHS